MSSGKYIGFLDADDYVSLTMYKTMYDAALNTDFPDIITTRLKFVSDNSYYSKEYDPDLKGRYLKIENNPEMIIYESPSCCNKLFKSSLIKNYRFIPNVMWEDVAFTYSCFIKADDVLMMSNLDYFYRRDIKNGVQVKIIWLIHMFLILLVWLMRLNVKQRSAINMLFLRNKSNFCKLLLVYKGLWK